MDEIITKPDADTGAAAVAGGAPGADTDAFAGGAPAYRVTKADLRRAAFRTWTIMCSWNYERQMHMGFMYALAPILDKLYANDLEARKAAYRRHMEFFNCTPQMTGFIVGLAASMEEENAASPETYNPESISMIKTSLMGPFSGIGDSFFQGTLRIITFGIGISIAQQGSALGPILAVVLFAVPSVLALVEGTYLGYGSGKRYLSKFYQEGLMDRIMQFASIVGLCVVGGMIASMVPISTPLEFTAGGTDLVLQGMLDKIVPKLLPLACTLGIYHFIRKGVSTNLLLLGSVGFGIVMSLLGLLS